MSRGRARHGRTRALPTALAGALAILLSTGGCDDILGGTSVGVGDNSSGDGTSTATQLEGIQAFGSVIANSSATYARLDVLGGDGQPLSGIRNPHVRLGDDLIALLSSGNGAYEISSTQSVLRYEFGGEYIFDFEVVSDEGEVLEYASVAQAPATGPTAEIQPLLIRYAGETLEISLQNMASAGVIRVFDSDGNVTYDTSAIESVDQIVQARDAMLDTTGPLEVVPASAFQTAGVYTVVVTSIEMSVSGGTNVDSDLGAASWFGAGSSISLLISFE